MAVRVGVRDLRENLRSWLDRVQKGEDVIVTERGRAIAQLTPLDSGRTRLEELVGLGIVRPPLRPKRKDIDILRLPELEGEGQSLSDLVVEERRKARY